MPLFSYAIEKINVSEYDLIISSSHCVAKGVKTRSNQLHICYMHTPVRYAWDLRNQYLRDNNLNVGLKSVIVNYFLDKLKSWDLKTANRPDHYIANSYYISNRIKRVYNITSTVIYPPVNIDKFTLNIKKDDFYLSASRLVSYKKIDLIVDAFANSSKKLIVIGDGPEMNKIKSKVTPNITIMGYQDDDVLVDYMKRAKAFIFAAKEDFGIIPVEAQACGTPVICLGKGGTKETVIHKKTGVHFQNQTKKDIINATNFFEKNIDYFNPLHIRQHALKFSTKRFEKKINKFVNDKYEDFIKNIENPNS